MRELPQVTLVCVDTRSYGQAINSLKNSLKQIKPARTIFFTDIDIPNLPAEIEVVKIAPLRSKEAYSTWIMRELYRHLTTDYVLVTQWDSWCLDSDCWSDEFLTDYIGANWLETDGFSVGNGGFSIRSRRLMEVVATDPIIVSTHPEDNMISKVYRPYLESKYGFKWASEKLADKFAFELKAPASKTFGFHSWFHEPFKEFIIINRSGAGGDCIMVEPILHHFHKLGYRVAFRTQPHFLMMFAYHYFKVYHPQEIDGRIVAREIDLDMAYETTPKQLHLKSYYEMCGIPDGGIRNPKLVLNFDPKNPNNKLFKKPYVTLHLDRRLQNSRNIFGVNWVVVVDYLLAEGYEVLQIGNGEHEEIPNAVQFNAPNEIMLMSIIGGADLHVGIDSGPSNIAVAMNTKAVICFGSVNPEYIIPDLTNVMAIHNHDKKVCELPFCWSESIGCTGTPCYIDDNIPPCSNFTTEQIIEGIKKAICK